MMNQNLINKSHIEKKQKFTILVLGANLLPDCPESSMLRLLFAKDENELKHIEIPEFGLALVIKHNTFKGDLFKYFHNDNIFEGTLYEIVKQGRKLFLNRFNLTIPLYKDSLRTWQLLEWLAADALSSRYGFIVGLSSSMFEVARRLEAASHELTDRNLLCVLISGATGVGKGEVAHAIHKISNRCKGPFVRVDCTSIPSNLFEAELFGSKKGSYTGSIYDSEGLILTADGGSLFLDEIGDVPIKTQPKLLQFLDERIVRPLGGTSSNKIDSKLIVATNRDLIELIKKRLFREDLYFRLCGITIDLPPLTERTGDIPFLIEHFLKKSLGRSTIKEKKIDYFFWVVKRALSKHHKISSYSWPGNIRELELAVNRSFILSHKRPIDFEKNSSFFNEIEKYTEEQNVLFNQPKSPFTEYAESLDMNSKKGYDELIEVVIGKVTEKLFKHAYDAAHGNISVASEKVLKIPRRRFYALKKKYNIKTK